MKFNEKLKQAMQQLNLSQAQVVGMTGIGKSSISQYLSGKNIPSEDRQKNIAVSLGLSPDYFAEEGAEPQIVVKKQVGGIGQLSIKTVAKLMHKHTNTISLGLQQGCFPWGYAIHTSEHRWSYFINAKRFSEIEGVEILQEQVIV